MVKKKTYSIPIIIWLFASLTIIYALFSPYFFQLLASISVLILLFIYFWRPGHPPIILAAFLYIWTNISIGTFYVIFFGHSYRELLWYPYYSYENINRTFWLSIIGLVFLATGTRLATGKALKHKVSAKEIYRLNGTRLILLFPFISALTEFLFHKIRFVIPGIAQFFSILRYFKWSFFFLATVYVFFTKKDLFLYWLIFFTSLLLAFTSYFSQFKNYFYMLPIGYITVSKLNWRQLLIIVVVGVMTFFLGVYWSYIKGDYRYFLSGGTNKQIVVVSKKAAIKKFFSYAKYFDAQRFKYGEQALFKRLFYLEFFSATVRYIPTYKPYMHGKNTIRAIKHILMPRILFPHKPAINDSQHTRELTGIYVAGTSQGTSISPGFFAEFYADYGPFAMNIALFVLGVLWGMIYSMVMKAFNYNIWAFAFAVPIFFIIYTFEKDLIKIIGDLVWFIIVFWTIKTFLSKFVIQFFTKKI